MASTETGWTKEFPKADGYYWWAISGEVRLLEVILGQREAWTQGDDTNQWEKAYYWTGKFLGPISPSDAEQLMELRSAMRFQYDALCELCENGLELPSSVHARLANMRDDARAALNPSQAKKEGK